MAPHTAQRGAARADGTPIGVNHFRFNRRYSSANVPLGCCSPDFGNMAGMACRFTRELEAGLASPEKKGLQKCFLATSDTESRLGGGDR
jgi:hypothetical protein